MFIQFHTLTGYASVLLNRDDSGMAKRLPYGDSVRTRVSSQSAKRKLRLAEGEHAISGMSDISVRSRQTFRKLIAMPLISEGHAEVDVIAATLSVMDAVFPLSEGGKKSRKTKNEAIAKGEDQPISILDRGEINVLSAAEVEYLKRLVSEGLASPDAKKYLDVVLADKGMKANLAVLRSSMSLDMAMFGRMTTGDVLVDVGASLHVAHAFSVHPQATEMDFFTAVDDLSADDGERGTGHMGDVEITSPLLYGYYVMDCRKLLSNISGLDNAGEVSGNLASRLVHLVAKHVVGAKLGGTAPYSRAGLVMVEYGAEQPRTLAEAFRGKVRPTLEGAVEAMRVHLDAETAMYGESADKRLVSCMLPTADVMGHRATIADLSHAVGAYASSAAV